jgi:hypothetical protein
VLPEPGEDTAPVDASVDAFLRVPMSRRTGPRPADGTDPTLWFVTVTLGGDPLEPTETRAALERLSIERPFVVSARYGSTRAEVRYWDEGDDVSVAIDQALRMWSDHTDSARLPKWRIVGLEVLDRETARRQWDSSDRRRVGVLGEIRPFEPPV